MSNVFGLNQGVRLNFYNFTDMEPKKIPHEEEKNVLLIKNELLNCRYYLNIPPNMSLAISKGFLDPSTLSITSFFASVNDSPAF
jgi:hypothetical protein